MSHTTSVRFVNLNLKTSRHAQIVNRVIYLGWIWALLFSSPPSVILFPLIAILTRFCFSLRPMYPSWLGVVRISRSGTVKQHGSTRYLQSVNRQFYWWFLSVKLSDGERFLLWRDSCDDVSYRQLQLILTQWQQKREPSDSL